MSDEDTGTASPENEARAKEMGWVSEENWVGDPPPNGFLSADDFVTRGETVLPIIQAQNRGMREEIKALKTSAKGFQQFANQAIARERQEKKDLIADLETQRADAITEGDGEAAVDAERKINKLRTEAVAPDAAVEEAVGLWLEDNAWFSTDPVMRSWADGRALQLASENVAPGLATLKRIASEVQAAFPEKFKGKPTPPSPEGGASRRKAASRGKVFADLPAEAKSAYADFKELMPEYSEKEYLDMYEWEE